MSRVAITTDRFKRAAPYFITVGLEPVPTPCIRFEPAATDVIDEARDAAHASDLLILTSARTVSLLWPAGDMPPCEVAAVGPATAEAVIAAGGRVDLTGTGGLADLVAELGDRLSSRRIAMVRASGSDPRAVRRLRHLVPGLEDHVVYEVVPVAPDLEPVDAVAFASPTAVEGWRLTRRLEDLVVGVIGETTAAALAPYRAPDVVASQPTYQALAEALGSFLEVTV